MRTFARRHPQVRVTIRNMSTAEQVRAIQEKRLHAGFVTPPVDDPDLVFETVLHEPIVLAVPREQVTTRLASEHVQRYLGGRAPAKVIQIPGRLVNVVTPRD